MGGVGTYIIPEEDIIHPVGEGLLLHKHTLLLQPFDVIFFKFTIHGDLRNKKFQWEGQYWRDVLGQLQTMLYPIYIGNPISTKFNTTPSIILISFSLYFALYIHSSLSLLKMFSLLNCISTVWDKNETLMHLYFLSVSLQALDPIRTLIINNFINNFMECAKITSLRTNFRLCQKERDLQITQSTAWSCVMLSKDCLGCCWLSDHGI